MDIMFPYSALIGTPLPLAQAQHLFHLTQFHPTFHVPHGYLHAYQHVAAPLNMGFGRPQVSLTSLRAGPGLASCSDLFSYAPVDLPYLAPAVMRGWPGG